MIEGLFGVGLEPGRRAADADVVDEDVHVAVACHDLVHRALAVGRARDVGDDRERLSPLAMDRAERAFSVRLLEVHDADAAAFSREELADRGPKADRVIVGPRPAAAHHERDLSGESSARLRGSRACRNGRLRHLDLPVQPQPRLPVRTQP